MNRNEKVLLVNPNVNLREPRAAEPLSLLTLAAQLQKEGFEPEILDGAVSNITVDQLSNHRILAVTANTPQYPDALRLLDLFNQVNNRLDKIALIGGPHVVTGYKQNILKDGWTGVCIGEGELVIGDMVRGNKTGLVIAPKIEDLDSLAFPARHLINPNIYVREGDVEPSISILTMRGCPYICIYCVKDVMGKKVRYHSPEYIAAQIREVINKYGIRKIVFYDDTFTLNRKRVFELCKKLKDLNVSWICNTRVDKVDEEILKAMKASGCEEISFGLESAHNRVLAFINKGITKEQAVLAVKMAKNAGLRTRVFLMFGFWEDGWDSVVENLKFLEETQPDIARLSLVVPLPGSELYRRAEEFGIQIKDVPLKQYYYLGPEGPHTFVKKTKYLNEKNFQNALAFLQKGMIEWATKKNTGTIRATNIISI
jgi:radical SAM superfamily enzyme YgiQ (UPF0313 family)